MQSKSLASLCKLSKERPDRFFMALNGIENIYCMPIFVSVKIIGRHNLNLKDSKGI